MAARQLDLVNDTALRDDKRLAVAKYSASSTVTLIPGLGRKYSASSTVESIERRRKTAGLSHEDLCRAAGISVRNWFRLVKGEQPATSATVAKLEAALSAPREGKPPLVISAFHRILIGLCAQALGEDLAQVLAIDMTKQRPANAAWLKASRIRMMATYITAVELEVSNAELGRAIGQTRAAIQKSRNTVEDLRDRPEIDAALVKVTQQVRA